VERELRRLRERAEQHEHQRHVGERPARGVGEEARHGGRVADDREDDQPGQHGESTRTGDEERPGGRRSGGGVRVVEADQQERGDRGEFPEDEQREQPVGPHDAEHRAGEGDEQTGEPAEVVAPPEVGHRVQQHEHPDARHQQAHQQPEPVESQRDRQCDLGDPLHLDRRRVAVEHGTALGDQPSERDRRSDRRNRQRPARGVSARCHADDRCEKVGEQEEDQRRQAIIGQS
jgi:hypothetical protein